MKKKILGIITAFVMVLSVVSFVPLKAVEERSTGGGPVLEYEYSHDGVDYQKSSFGTTTNYNQQQIFQYKDMSFDFSEEYIYFKVTKYVYMKDQDSKEMKTYDLNEIICEVQSDEGTGTFTVENDGNGLFKIPTKIFNRQGSVLTFAVVGTRNNRIGNATIKASNTNITSPNIEPVNFKGEIFKDADGQTISISDSGQVTYSNDTGNTQLANYFVYYNVKKDGTYVIDKISLRRNLYRDYFFTYDVATSELKFISSEENSSKWPSYLQIGNTYKLVIPVQEVTLGQTKLTLEKGKTTTLTATITPTNATDKKVTWNSSDSSIATVDSAGKVTGIKAGTTTITATVNGKKAECTVTVFEVKPPVIETTPSTGDKTTVSVDKEAVEVLEETVKEVVKNVETTTAISETTKTELKKAIEEGKEISVKPAVAELTEATVEKEVVAKIEKVLGTKEKVVQYFDLSMNLTADGEPIGTINELTGKVAFTVTIDKDLIKTGRTFYMVRVHEDGSVEKINGTLKDGEFTFETDKFSTYALVYDDTKVETPTKPTDTTTPTETPKDTNKGVDTGDTTSTNALFALMGLAIVGMGSVVYRKRVSRK